MDSQAEVLIDRLKNPGQKIRVSGHVGASKALWLAQAFGRLQKTVIVVTADLKEAGALSLDLKLFAPKKAEVSLFPPLDVLPYFNLSPHTDLILERLSLLWKWASAKEPFLGVVPLHALTRRLIPKKIFWEKKFILTRGDTINRDELTQKLVGSGYQRMPLVEDCGTFAIRGGILDIFSPAETTPCRLELLGDTIESIRRFDPVSQKSLGAADSIVIIPAREILFDVLDPKWKTHLKDKADSIELPKTERDRVAEQIGNHFTFSGIESFIPFFYKTPSTLFDYLPADTLFCFLDEEDLKNRWKKEMEDHAAHREKASGIEKIFVPEEIFLTVDEIDESLAYFSRIDFSEIDNPGWPSLPLAIETNRLLQTQLIAARSHEKALQPLADLLDERRRAGHHLFLVAGSPAQKERLTDLLGRYQIPLQTPQTESEKEEMIQGAVSEASPSPFVRVFLGPLSEGFFWTDQKQWWLTDEEIFGKKIHKLPAKPSGEPLLDFSSLEAGDFVVHSQHGIGVYRGLNSMTFGALFNDFLLIEYLGGDKLYVPVDKLNLVTRYASKEGEHPLLDKMGGTSWKKTREKVKRATRRLAKQLLELQAERAAQKGFAFSPQDEMFEEFEATFPYEETPDQLLAIDQVCRDMESERPMDRLVCGDVGYGKTEVAIRAAFKAVCDRKQVAVLVPTTVLAFQHFETFKKRFSGYPLTVELLSRFQTPTEQKKILEKIGNGEVDIVIATHRLLSSDVKFRDLGLLVIDEEHRFGVAQKEKIKRLKRLVDVLTLSATPIPRTLNFALVGIRDLSLINTPPADRLSIRTFVTHFDEATLRESILREVSRGGQIYFVHNRVQTIDDMKQRLSKIVPEIKIEIAHGQMDEEKLEEVMIGFMEKKFEILLCTTIIESGLDIPSANTIIMNRADHLGLAQMYQLRGRVGRSQHRAYAYLIVPHDTLITEQAKKRLAVIQRFTELGSGFKIASYDLEIRGAGNILGPEQSGQIAAVGYDLYVQLLKQAVAELKGELEEEEVDPELKLNISAYLPEDLVPDTSLRLALYKQLASLTHEADALSVRDEWIDRFGKLPPPVESLIGLMRIKVLAQKLRLAAILAKPAEVTLQVHPSSPIPTDYFLEKVKKQPKKYKIIPDGKFVIHTGSQSETAMLETIRNYLVEMGGSLAT